MACAARRSVGALRLLDLPAELLQLVARFAFEHAYETGFAFASRATMDATARPLGLDSVFAICAHAALERIARRTCARARLFLRLRLVRRAMEAGNDAELYVWPAEAVDGPRPSPLREHPWASPHARTEYSFPMEHNVQVGLGHPDPTGEFESRHSLDYLSLWTNRGHLVELLDPTHHFEPWYFTETQHFHADHDVDVLGRLGLCFGNDKRVDLFGASAHAYALHHANVERLPSSWLRQGCLRRYAIRLQPNAF